MAILIVDEPDARRVLRRFLGEMGHDVVLEARSGEAAFRMLEEHRTKVRIIISGLGLPGMDGLALMKTVRGACPWADFTGFLLLTSDFRRGQTRGLTGATSRPDSYLQKPFKRSQLEQALSDAMFRRNARRDTLLYVGNVGEEMLRIQSALKRHEAHWNQVLHCSSEKQLEERLEDTRNRAGALLIDPEVHSKMREGWLGRFRRSPIGSLTTVVCLGRSGGYGSELRKHCQIFFEPGSSEAEWIGFLRRISLRTRHSWDLERLAEIAKRKSREKQPRTAARFVARMLSLDPDNSHAHALMAEVQLSCRRPAASITHFERALASNPCSPHPHLMLMELAETSASADRRRFAEEALKFCPNHPEIRAKAAEILRWN